MSANGSEWSRALVVYGRSDKQLEKRHQSQDSDDETSDNDNENKPAKASNLVPSHEEMDRLDRWAKLQERLAAINNPPAQGHTYGNLTVTGNARAIRGNICSDASLLPYTRRHTYGRGEVHGNGMILEGDISVAELKMFRKQAASRNRA